MKLHRWLAVATAAACIVSSAQAQQPKPAVPEGTKVEKNLEYGPNGDRNKLDLYVPKADAPLPLIIWVHGGAWKNGNKDSGGPGLFLLPRGYAIASINYRLSDKGAFPTQIEDCKAAVRFLRANAKKYNLDPDRFGAWGASAGGHLVALMGTAGDGKDLEGKVGGNEKVSSRVQAVCDWFGPTDLVKLRGNSTSGSGAIEALIGGSIADKKAVAEMADPIKYVTKDDPPFLIVHGDQDPTVPLNQSEILHEALKKAGVESKLHVIKGAKHGGPEFNSEDTRKVIEEFFARHLKNKGAK